MPKKPNTLLGVLSDRPTHPKPNWFMPVRYGLAIALVLTLVGCVTTGPSSRSGPVSTTVSAADTSITVPGGEFRFSNVEATMKGLAGYGMYLSEDAVLKGTVTNNSDRAFTSTKFDLVAYDLTGRRLGDVSVFILETLAPGASYMLSDDYVPGLGRLGEYGPSEFRIENVRARFPVSYSFEMIAPAESESLTFADDNLEIVFVITQSNMGFALRNASDEPIRINWDDISYVDPSGRSHRVMHQGIKYNERENPQAPKTVPPGARIEDTLQPTDMVRFVKFGSRSEWRKDTLFPGGEAAFRTEGQEFSVFMPLTIGGETVNYNFQFRVADVDFHRN